MMEPILIVMTAGRADSCITRTIEVAPTQDMSDSQLFMRGAEKLAKEIRSMMEAVEPTDGSGE